MKYDTPVYEFRPLNEDGRKLLRYNNGNWIADDGEYDICFITDSGGAPMCFYVSPPYRKNILWSWCENMIWYAHIHKHPNENAWHYMSKDGSCDISESWDRDKHPNVLVSEIGMNELSKKNGCANGSGISFHVNEKHIVNGLVRNKSTKKILKAPKVFNCIYCGKLEVKDELIDEYKKLKIQL